MKTRLMIIVAGALLISFVSGWMIGISTFYYTDDPNSTSERSYMFPTKTKLLEDEFKELECLRLYKDIREVSRTPEMQVADQQTINIHKTLVFEYVEKKCPDFQDLEFWYDNYKQNMSVSEPKFQPEPEPEPNPIPEEFDDAAIKKQDHYISPFDEEWIHRFQEDYHTVITGKVTEWYGQKQPSKYDYQYRVEALAHHTPRMQEDSTYIILGDENNFIPVNADVVLFGLDKDDDGSLYIVNTLIQEKPEP